MLFQRQIATEVVGNQRAETRSLIFQAVLILISFILSLLIWRYVANSVHITAALDMAWIAGLVTCFMAVIILALAVFSVRAATLPFLSFLAGFLLLAGMRWEYIAGAFISFLLFLYGAKRARNQADNQLKISFYDFLRYGAPQTLTALALLFALVGYFYPINFATVQLPRETFEYAAPFVETIIGSFAPAYKPGMTLDEFFLAGAGASLDNLGNMKENAAIKALIDQEIKKQRGSLSEQIGVKLTGQEKLPDIISAVSGAYLSRYLTRYQNIAPAIIALSVFLGVKSFGLIIDRLAVLLAWIFAKILLALNIIRKQKTTVDKEILTI